MIGDRRDLLGEVGAKKLFEALHHFARSLTRKGYGEDGIDGHFPLVNDIGDAVRNRARLACARHGVDEHRSTDMAHRRNLARRQFVPIERRRTEINRICEWGVQCVRRPKGVRVSPVLPPFEARLKAIDPQGNAIYNLFCRVIRVSFACLFGSWFSKGVVNENSFVSIRRNVCLFFFILRLPDRK